MLRERERERERECVHVLTTLSAFNSALRLLKSPSIWRRENETDRFESDGQTEREKMHQRLKISVWKKKMKKRIE